MRTDDAVPVDDGLFGCERLLQRDELTHAPSPRARRRCSQTARHVSHRLRQQQRRRSESALLRNRERSEAPSVRGSGVPVRAEAPRDLRCCTCSARSAGFVVASTNCCSAARAEASAEASGSTRGAEGDEPCLHPARPSAARPRTLRRDSAAPNVTAPSLPVALTFGPWRRPRQRSCVLWSSQWSHAAGYDLEDVVVTTAGRRSVVRVVVDRDGGIDLDAVAEVSSAVSDALDAADVVRRVRLHPRGHLAWRRSPAHRTPPLAPQHRPPGRGRRHQRADPRSHRRRRSRRGGWRDGVTSVTTSSGRGKVVVEFNGDRDEHRHDCAAAAWCARRTSRSTRLSRRSSRRCSRRTTAPKGASPSTRVRSSTARPAR